VSELPSGTVSLLFSDIEGSTALLKRLGTAYAEALSGQRQLLRQAWTEQGGIELGTEGDSFFVVFPTAEAAVAAATQGQRALAAFEWPAGEQVRVRMGIHTGTPAVSEGGYVGMDVHRAARIAGATHGGQVVVSSTTAELVTECLPDRVRLKDVGWHQLKDITNPEHLFQLVIEGLQRDFPPLRTLGTVSSLPRPATPLVGRDGELAELTALLSSPGVRLVTLTGPGGSGKTRLAIGVAERLVERFTDGVYFVPLVAVTTAEVMWTTIAEVLNVPSEGRVPPAIFEYVAHRIALFVVDNLEQIDGADDVVAELLDVATEVVVIATTRRPLHVPAEHEHPVPPLEVPDDTTVTAAESCGAIQLFVHHATKVRPTFRVTAANVGDVAEICRRLDGLPLAIELAAARSKLLSPAALLTRLDTALDIAAIGRRAPDRQKTLRDTIRWSCALLKPVPEALFYDLGVFAGGADVDAISAVSGDKLNGDDLLDVVADLVDVSLVTMTEAADGEPRVHLLETIRAYARDHLRTIGQLDTVQQRYALHYLQLAESWKSQLDTAQYVQTRDRFETEHDNFRGALRWALGSNEASGVNAAPLDLQLGLRLCVALSEFWFSAGHFLEMRRWLELVTDAAARGDPSDELAECLFWQGRTLDILGDLHAAHQCASASVMVRRRMGADTSGLVRSLTLLADMESSRGQPATARALFQQALGIARDVDDSDLHLTLLIFALFEHGQRNYQTSLELNAEALGLARQLGRLEIALTAQGNLACSLRQLGRLQEAQEHMRAIIPPILQRNSPSTLMTLAEDYSAVLADLGDHHAAVRLLGAAEALRDRFSAPRMSLQQAEIGEPIAKCRAALSAQDWDDAYRAGRNMTVEAAFAQVHAATSG
jgi:predicted ATPase/class 3 adenylate cyclase